MENNIINLLSKDIKNVQFEGDQNSDHPDASVDTINLNEFSDEESSFAQLEKFIGFVI